MACIAGGGGGKDLAGSQHGEDQDGRAKSPDEEKSKNLTQGVQHIMSKYQSQESLKKHELVRRDPEEKAKLCPGGQVERHTVDGKVQCRPSKEEDIRIAKQNTAQRLERFCSEEDCG